MASKKGSLGLSSRLADHLINAVFIFTSVFLAFWLTERRDASNKADTLKVSLQHIATEMAYNHQRVEHTYQYHTLLLRQIDSLRGLENTDWKNLSGFYLKGWVGVEMPILRSTAYQTFLNTGINDIAPFELAKALADIYNAQSIVERFDNAVLDYATSNNDFTDLPKLRHYTGIYTEILPEVIINYQTDGRKWLKEYGYDLSVTETKLKAMVAERMTGEE